MSAVVASSFDADLRERAIAEATASTAERARAATTRAARALAAVPTWIRVSIAVATAILVFAAIMPTVAHAVPADYDDLPALSLIDPTTWFDHISWIIVYGIFGSLANGMLSGCVLMLYTWTNDSILTSGFYEMLSAGDAGSIGALAVSIADTVIKPCAFTILGMVMLIQLVEIARRMDQQGGTLPTVREVLVMFFFYAVCIALVGNAETIMQGIFWLVQEITEGVRALLIDSSGAITVNSIDFPDDMTLFDMGVILLATLIAWLVSFALAIVGSFMGIMRALEIYLYTMFCPIPFSLMGLDATRQWGMGFLKEFIATCLSGTILVIITFLAPYLVKGMAGDLGTYTPGGIFPGVGEVTLAFHLLSWVVKFIAVEICILIALVKSGRLARSILGG